MIRIGDHQFDTPRIVYVGLLSPSTPGWGNRWGVEVRLTGELAGTAIESAGPEQANDWMDCIHRAKPQ